MKTLLLGMTVTALATTWYLTRPNKYILASSVTDMQGRSKAQQQNIRQAAQALHKEILPPRRELSFNALVGPRTRERGFVPAPAFMTASHVTSVGGGICQVSSALYGAALQAGLAIIERHAHFAPVESVLPGLDATVWFGIADVRLRNPYPWPIQIESEVNSTTLTIRLRAPRPVTLLPITRHESWRDSGHLVVNVYRGNHHISTNTYAVPN